jgi:hypothetical protein
LPFSFPFSLCEFNHSARDTFFEGKVKPPRPAGRWGAFLTADLVLSRRIRNYGRCVATGVGVPRLCA